MTSVSHAAADNNCFCAIHLNYSYQQRQDRLYRGQGVQDGLHQGEERPGPRFDSLSRNSETVDQRQYDLFEV